MKRFKRDGVYSFDTIYRCCEHRVDDTDCSCNNGYICGHKDCGEACEDNSSLGKCYSFTCPLVSASASKDTIKMGLGDYSAEDIDSINFDDEDFTCDYEKLVVWL